MPVRILKAFYFTLAVFSCNASGISFLIPLCCEENHGSHVEKKWTPGGIVGQKTHDELFNPVLQPSEMHLMSCQSMPPGTEQPLS